MSNFAELFGERQNHNNKGDKVIMNKMTRENNKRRHYIAPSTSYACVESAMPIAASAARTEVVIQEKTTITIDHQKCETFNEGGVFADLGAWEN